MRKYFLTIVWLTLCAVFGYYAPTLPVVRDYVAIKEVVIKGTQKLSEEDVKYLFRNENWFFVSESSILEKATQRYPFIESLQLRKPYFGMLEVEVKERKPYGIVRVMNSKMVYIVDEKGFLIKDTSFYSERELSNLKLIMVDNLQIALNVLKYIKSIEHNSGGLEFKEFIIRASTLSAITSDSKIVVLSTENIEDSLNKLRIFARKQSIKDFSYLNFSFDSMVIVKK